MEIMGREYEVDVETVLLDLGLRGVHQNGANFSAACPFHKEGLERHPSFSVHVIEGLYNCHRCHVAGTLVGLVAEMTPDGVRDHDEAARWLIRRYVTFEKGNRKLELNLERSKPKDGGILDEATLDPYQWRHPYLYRRGLSEESCQFFELGYDRTSKCITLPWRDRLGNLRLVKRRSVETKRFLNSTGAEKTNLLYALNHVQFHGFDTVYLVEGELKAIYLWQNQKPAIALGSNWLNPDQVLELMKAGVRRVRLMYDQDGAGTLGDARAIQLLSDHFRLSRVIYPRKDAKDANDLSASEVNCLSSVPII